MLTSICYSKKLMDDEIDQEFSSPKLSDYCELYNFQLANTKALLNGLVSLPDCFYKDKKAWVTFDGKELAALPIWDSELTIRTETSHFSVFVLLDDASLVMVQESDGVTKHIMFSTPARIARESDRMCVDGVFYLHDLYDSIFEKRFIYPFKIDEGWPEKSPKFY
jgi:hypothetical protein